MTKEQFKEYVLMMVREYGVRSCFDNIDEDGEVDMEDLWFECPVCGEPILYDDYADSGLLNLDICPVCEELFGGE